MVLTLKLLKSDFSVCKLRDLSRLNLSAEFYFLSRTPSEISLVCFSEDVPDNAIVAEAGWKAFRIDAQLDFSLVGILARISSVLAVQGISIFAVSTYDTDYILVKADKLDEAKQVLKENDYLVE